MTGGVEDASEFRCPLSDEPPEDLSALPPPAWAAAATMAWNCAGVTQVEPTQIRSLQV
jgi:hypothetical protein